MVFSLEPAPAYIHQVMSGCRLSKEWQILKIDGNNVLDAAGEARMPSRPLNEARGIGGIPAMGVWPLVISKQPRRRGVERETAPCCFEQIVQLMTMGEVAFRKKPGISRCFAGAE